MFLDSLRQAIGSVFLKIADFAHLRPDPALRLPPDTLSVSPEARAASQAQQDDDPHGSLMAAVFPGQESGSWIQLAENKATQQPGRGRRQPAGDDSVLA